MICNKQKVSQFVVRTHCASLTFDPVSKQLRDVHVRFLSGATDSLGQIIERNRVTVMTHLLYVILFFRTVLHYNLNQAAYQISQTLQAG